MAKYVVFAEISDGYIASADYNYSTARNGTGTSVVASATSTSLQVGQGYYAPLYGAYEAFISFDTSAVANQIVSSVLAIQTTGTVGVNGIVDIYARDWGTSLTTTDWVAGASLSGLTKVGSTGCGATISAGSVLTAMINSVTASSATRFLLASSRLAAGSVPTGDESLQMYSADTSGTTSDPTLTVYTSVRSSLTTVGNGLVQLSDGAWVSLRSNGAVTPTITLAYSTDGTTWTSIATIPTGTTSSTFNVSSIHGHQILELVVDPSDNLYVVGYRGDDLRGAAKCYAKGSGHSWTAKTLLSTTYNSLPGGEGAAVNAVYDSTTDTMLVALFVTYKWSVGTFGNAYIINAGTMSASVLRAGSGTLSPLNEFSGGVFPEINIAGGMGCAFATGSVTHPVVIRCPVDGYGFGIYDAEGSQATLAPASAAGIVNGESKIRAMKTAPNVTWFVGDDSQGSYSNPGCFIVSGLTVDTSFIRTVAYDAATSNTTQNQPANSKVSQTLKWDAFYDSVRNKIWVYFLDTTDSRKLHRTSFSLISNVWVNDDATVSNTVGASGSSNLAVRCVPNPASTNAVLVEVANLDGSTHSIVSIVDAINDPPLAPTLIQPLPFDATQSKGLSWGFNDPGDSETAYQLEISNNATGATAVNTGKVTDWATAYTMPANTLTNNVTWKWRVTTWDSADIKGATSAWQTFTTTTPPVVTITAPAAPLTTTDFNTYTVVWTYSQAGGSPQQSYRLRALRTSDSSVLYDSGTIISTATSAIAINLLSESITIEVTAKSALGGSTTVTQTLLPTFASPDQPTFTATSVNGGIRIDITNPTPTGSKPTPTHNQLWSKLSGHQGEPAYTKSGDYYLIMDDIAINSSVYDYGVLAGSETYFVRAVAE